MKVANLDDASLLRIVNQIVGIRPGLYVPNVLKVARERTGARFVLAPGRHELPGDPATPEEFFGALLRLPMPQAVVGLSAISLIVAKESYLAVAHKHVNVRFLSPDRLRDLQQSLRESAHLPDIIHVFNRVGILLLQRLAIAVSSRGNGKDTEPDTLLGEVALIANDYVVGNTLRGEKRKHVDYVTMMVEMLPGWDVVNGPDLAYGLTRAYRLFQVHLLGDDSIVAELRSKLRIDFSKATFDGLSIDEYVACIFGIYSWYQTLDTNRLISGEINCVIDTAGFLAKTFFPKESFERFLAARSRTIDELSGLISNEPIDSAESLAQKLQSDSFIANTIAIRSFPLCKLDATQLVCLDTSFLSELLIYGLYWRILDSLRKDKEAGDVFISLWGRLLELYLNEQLQFHYPSAMSPLSTDVAYADGQVDALFDFGNDVVLFEFKGSLLKAESKYNRNADAFKADFALKFVQNEKGDPKALRQLARSSAAAANGSIKLSTIPTRIFPVLVGYESALDSFFVNRFADDVFRELLKGGLGEVVQPLTVMSVEAFEIAISHTSAGDIAWPALLDRRFKDGKVTDQSVSQAIYDWRSENHIEVRRNQFILRDFRTIFDRALAKYKPDPDEKDSAE